MRELDITIGDARSRHGVLHAAHTPEETPERFSRPIEEVETILGRRLEKQRALGMRSVIIRISTTSHRQAGIDLQFDFVVS